MSKLSVTLAVAIDTGKLVDCTYLELAARGFGKPETDVTAADIAAVQEESLGIRSQLWTEAGKLYAAVTGFYFGDSNNRGEGCDRQPPKDEVAARRCLQPGQVRMGLYWIQTADDLVMEVLYGRKAKTGVNYYINTSNFAMRCIDLGLLKPEKIGLLMPERLQLVYQRVHALAAA